MVDDDAEIKEKENIPAPKMKEAISIHKPKNKSVFFATGSVSVLLF